MKYLIKETWRVYGSIEKYDREIETITEVRKYIKDWIESWQEYAEEKGEKFCGLKTDYVTFAKCKISIQDEDLGHRYDTFSLIAKKA